MKKTMIGEKPAVVVTLKTRGEGFDWDVEGEYALAKRFGLVYVTDPLSLEEDGSNKTRLDYYANVRIRAATLATVLTEGGTVRAGSGYAGDCRVGKIGYGKLTVRLTKHHVQIKAPCGATTTMTRKQARDLAEAVVSL